MPYCVIRSRTTVHVHNLRNLIAVYPGCGTPCLVETFYCEQALTPKQLRRLPKDLRLRLKHGSLGL
jgi:hypothetical protein